MTDVKNLVVSARIQIPEREFTFTFARSSGAGGQNVNKVNSKAILRWNPLESLSLPADVRERLLKKYSTRLTAEGDLILMSDAFRDQTRNVADCLEKLGEILLSVATAPKKRIKTKPSRSAKRRRVEGKRRDSVKKQGRGRVGLDD